ncbi:twin-arginine translocation signal domain-containing protein [Nocardia arthritidis]|nr:twin-arginine translocation signal domain-containing protein [Nocardia arthritidis]
MPPAEERFGRRSFLTASAVMTGAAMTGLLGSTMDFARKMGATTVARNFDTAVGITPDPTDGRFRIWR